MKLNHIFIKSVLRAYSVPGILLGLGNMAMNRSIIAAGFPELTRLLFTFTSD